MNRAPILLEGGGAFPPGTNEILEIPKPPPSTESCYSDIYVGLGNKNLIGSNKGAFPHGRDGYGGPISKDSAAIFPSQFGKAVGDMRPIVDHISGTIFMGPKTNIFVTFNSVRDTIGQRDIQDPVTKKWYHSQPRETERIIKARHPGTIVIELPGLQSYPGYRMGTNTTPEVYFGVIYVPVGSPCPVP
jgi:hypothetical protein